jgi:hypothetical protein
MKFKALFGLAILCLVTLTSNLWSQSLFPVDMYRIQNLKFPQLSQQFTLHINQVLNSGQQQAQENLLQGISQYFQKGQTPSVALDAILMETDEAQRIQLVDQWYLNKESSNLANDIKTYSEKTLVWKRSIRGAYLPPQSSPHARELAVHLLLTMKPQGYMTVLEKYASFPDAESQGKYIMMRQLRHQWDHKETFNIYKAMAEEESNTLLKTMANRELALYIRRL